MNRGNGARTYTQISFSFSTATRIGKDMPALADEPPESPNAIYIEVSNLDDVLGRLNGIDLVVPKRTTFYGATEIGVREPGGNLIVFAMQGQGEGAHE